MPVLPIITFPNPVLKKRAEEVEVITPEILTLLSDMVETMYAAPGIGLAANQVGKLLRVVVIDVDDPEDEEEEKFGLLKLINPEIVSHSGTKRMTYLTSHHLMNGHHHHLPKREKEKEENNNTTFIVIK